MGGRDPLKRYQIMEPLGAGGQGSTFRAIDRESGEQVAVKVLSLRRLQQWKGFDLFEREIKTLRTLAHPAIPAYLDNYASEASGDFFLVMEFIDGVSLSEFVGGERRLSRAQLEDVFSQTLDILAYLHELTPPVIHRDVKPANLVRRPDGKIALVDFGGVRSSASAEGSSTMVGTFGYMAPEQLYGSSTSATDIYGLGATVAALATGVPASDLPHDGLRVSVESLDLPASLRRVLPGMLEPEPGDRLGSVAEVRARMRAAKPVEPPKASAPKTGSTETKALAKIPPAAVALAEVAAPWSVFVWIAAALASGVLLVVEAVLLPLAFQLVAALQGDHVDVPRRERLARRFERYRRSTRRSRETTSYVAGRTRPGD